MPEQDIKPEALVIAKSWWVYMVQTRSNKLYTGITTDVERRFRQHKGELKGGARFFYSDAAKAVVYREASENRSSASRREAEIKKLTRQQKLAMVSGFSG
jgi:putative endonuclease